MDILNMFSFVCVIIRAYQIKDKMYFIRNKMDILNMFSFVCVIIRAYQIKDKSGGAFSKL